LSLPYGQDALIDAVAAANPRTIVVLETGNPVAMPWRQRVEAIVEAWFPGQSGGEAIAEVLTGVVSPSGRLPMTFPRSIEQMPHQRIAGGDVPLGTSDNILVPRRGGGRLSMVREDAGHGALRVWIWIELHELLLRRLLRGGSGGHYDRGKRDRDEHRSFDWR
jgi:hypothetical protein